jgi:Cu+-exporting ATPase
MLRTRTLSVATVRNIRQNRVFAFMYNGLSIPIAASLLYPFSGQLLSPKIAALPMSLSSASVVFNDLRLRQARVGERQSAQILLRSGGLPH